MTKLIVDRFGSSADIGVDMPNWDLGELRGAQITAFTDTTVTFTADSHTYILRGHDFTFDVSGDTTTLAGGTIRHIDVFAEPRTSSDPEFSIGRFTMTVDRFHGFVDCDDAAGFKDALFSNRDHMCGGSGIDTLTGLMGDDCLHGGCGNDMLHGGGGDDWLQGDRGADFLVGGAGSDFFVFASAKDSGGGVYDTIYRFDRIDKIVVPGGVTGFDGQVDAGASSSFNVDPVLSAALDADHLGAHHAAIATAQVTVRHGPIVYQTYLVVDVNGVAGYQAGEDIAVLIANPRGLDHIGVDDFLAI
jgi:RTX calcium-binding nonapeptide repeat (4 copies)